MVANLRVVRDGYLSRTTVVSVLTVAGTAIGMQISLYLYHIGHYKLEL